MDLRLRGQGDFFGTRQSGLPNLRIAQMSEDFDLISKTRVEAQRILKSTPKLLHQKPLGKSVERYMLQVIGETA
jgi:RecG-like helicase